MKVSWKKPWTEELPLLGLNAQRDWGGIIITLVGATTELRSGPETAGIDIPSSWKEARQIWQHRPLRRGQLSAGVNVFEGWHDTATSANTGKTVNWTQLLWCCWDEELLGWCSLKLQVQKKPSGRREGEEAPHTLPIHL